MNIRIIKSLFSRLKHMRTADRNYSKNSFSHIFPLLHSTLHCTVVVVRWVGSATTRNSAEFSFHSTSTSDHIYSERISSSIDKHGPTHIQVAWRYSDVNFIRTHRKRRKYNYNLIIIYWTHTAHSIVIIINIHSFIYYYSSRAPQHLNSLQSPYCRRINAIGDNEWKFSAKMRGMWSLHGSFH